MRMSFKTNNIRDVQLALSEQSAVHPRLSKSFNGTKEIPSSGQALSGRAALEAAKAKRTAIAKQASLQSEIIIGVGQGRSSRECELIWYPIFHTSNKGILTVRIYVGKSPFTKVKHIAYCIPHFLLSVFHLVKLLMKDLILESANSMLPQEHQVLMALNRITNKKIKTHVLVNMFNVLT